ncbi:unnamed protein product [Peronospora destructor]|uniref:Uncharacterized protein n=1 Tax=Peronospora destructor TaxID=86335 RepID=A0AAV0URC2_9STRA|nr:unnamed protein product [Peronospora destructor]
MSMGLTGKGIDEIGSENWKTYRLLHLSRFAIGKPTTTTYCHEIEHVLLYAHSSEHYEVKYLDLGDEDKKTVESLRPNERISLPLSLLMKETEFCARCEGYGHWIIRTLLNNDVLTFTTIINELDEHENGRKAKTKQRRGETIVYASTEETGVEDD